jgi:hypothetical protein
VSSEEYQYLVRKMNGDGISASPKHRPLVDLLKEKYGAHPTTYAGSFSFFSHFDAKIDVHPESAMTPRETTLTHTADLCTQLCIDYMLLLNSKENENSKKILFKDTRVEEFFITHPHVPITQISDHYAVTCNLEVK